MTRAPKKPRLRNPSEPIENFKGEIEGETIGEGEDKLTIEVVE